MPGGQGDDAGEETEKSEYREQLERLTAAADEELIRGHVGYDMYIEGDSASLDVFLEVFEDEFVVERTDSPEALLIPYDENEGADDDGRLGRVAIVDCIHDTLGTDVFHGSWFTAIGRS
ncbi:hypothetical protein [Natronobiforma cellulositropha]|uniref:hypothetical protein n=1 Tax=Natronobiforma cellulositropha TaxID=1679076 RepID=UPI0021D5A398|nr:hypothetical protein [Natronobiforma cellulositropha]